MRVRVKKDMSGFIYGVFRTEGKVFNLKPVKHSTEKDAKGKPVVISVEDQFSKTWMEEVKKGSDEPKEPAEMKVGELKEALEEAEIEIPEGAVKADLIVLLEDHLAEE